MAEELTMQNESCILEKTLGGFMLKTVKNEMVNDIYLCDKLTKCKNELDIKTILCWQFTHLQNIQDVN